MRVADGYSFTTATMALVLGDHAGTHVDAPKHFSADPKAKSIDDIYLTVLSRKPSSDENKRMQQFITKQGEARGSHPPLPNRKNRCGRT